MSRLSVGPSWSRQQAKNWASWPSRSLKKQTEQTAETTSCEQKAMTWWETSKTTPRHRQTTETTQTNKLMSLQLTHGEQLIMSLQLRQHRLLRQHWQKIMSHQLTYGEQLIMSLQLRQHRTTQTTDTTQRPLKANTLVSTDTTQTLERTQTLDISLTTERVIATAPTSEGNGDLASARRRFGLPQARRGLWHRVGDACLRLIYVPVGVWPTKVRPADVLSGRLRPHSLKM